MVNPFWRIVFDGCQVCRQTYRAIEANGFEASLPLIVPFEENLCSSEAPRLGGEAHDECPRGGTTIVISVLARFPITLQMTHAKQDVGRMWYVVQSTTEGYAVKE